jgi:Flp pilus assembly protein TadD/predicted Zn-dependent protease with MMP-like domain
MALSARTPRGGSLLGVALAFLCVAGCRSRHQAPPLTTSKAMATTLPPAAACPPAKDTEPPPRPLRRCFEDVPPWVDSPVGMLLDRAGEDLDRSDADGALACAEEAARQAPRSVEAHHDRAVALIRLGRLDEARDSLSLALALSPSDPETLELAADFYVNHLAPSAERAAIGLEFARRGLRYVGRDRSRAGHLSLLEGQALIDLGRASEALKPIAVALKQMPRDSSALYERGVALFELCRFEDSSRAFERVLEIDPGHAHALFHLGLIEERQGDEESAHKRFARASALDSKSFPAVPEISPADFAARVRRVAASLSTELRRDLAGILVDTAELPSVEDLTAEMPPLSPTILGLFRGLPLGRDDVPEAPPPSARGPRGRQARAPGGATASANPASYDTPERAIVLYRRNILRSVQAASELDAAIERTLLHEIGHLRGEDDGSLRDRGLE